MIASRPHRRIADQLCPALMVRLGGTIAGTDSGGSLGQDLGVPSGIRLVPPPLL